MIRSRPVHASWALLLTTLVTFGGACDDGETSANDGGGGGDAVGSTGQGPQSSGSTSASPTTSETTTGTSTSTGSTPIEGTTRVFYDGFEDGTTDAWSFGACPVVGVAPDGQGPHAGAMMAQCNWNGFVDYDDPQSTLSLVLDHWDYEEEFLLRFAIRNDTDLDHADGAKWMRLGFGGPEEVDAGAFNQNWPDAGLWFYPLGPGAVPNYWGEAGIVGDNQWHQIAMYFKNDTNDTDGIIRAWVDGVLIYEVADGTCFRLGANEETTPCEANTHEPGASRTPFNVMSNWSSNPGWEHDAENHVLWDEIEIFSDAANGSPACAGSMAEGNVTVCN
ncbi:MAG: hypothetical protein HOV80_33495 [Polyangiaceae bacterium]|nr:hypothetical protein [Polyangiaceae bacterium]